jgi:peroxiredoxin
MEQATSLTEQLAAFKAGFKQRAAPERVALMETATADLKATGIELQALQAGSVAPDLTLPDALNQPLRLSTLWCPYCNLELRAWQQHLPALKHMGAQLVAVSPQTPDNSLSTAEKNELAFPVLSDSSLQAATAFGVAFEMSPELIELYSRVGNDLPVLNGNGRWVLPVPATYVIDRDGRVVYAHIEADYRERAEPSDVLASIAQARDAASI